MSSSKFCHPTSDGFPKDMLNEILVRLPVKSLLQCRAVCKLWFSLISSCSFVKSHFSHAITSPRTEETLVLNNFQRSAEGNNSIIFLDLSSCQIVCEIKFFHSQSELPFVRDSVLVGSCAGIICVTIYTDDPEENWRSLTRGEGHTSTYLCNPATNQYKLIPPPNNHCETLRFALGFGFDPIDNDFKVVRFIHHIPSAVEVYSANMNVWQNVESVPIDVSNSSNFRFCCNGFLCGIGDDGILAFDLNKEVFTCGIGLPDRSYLPCITVFNDSIAAIIGEGKSGKIKLWTLDDVGCFRGGGVEASWTLMLSIDADLPVHFVHSYFDSSDLLLKSDDEVWYLYNSNQKVAKKVPVTSPWDQIFKYTESLVSITKSKQGK